MPGKISADTVRALKLVDSGKYNISQAAEKVGIPASTVRRAMRRRGDPPRPQSNDYGRGRTGTD